MATFGSRYAPQAAPLFQATLEDDEDDEEERDREAADLYALQRSRRVFAASRLDESTENEDDGSRASLEHSGDDDSRVLGDRIRGIRSSWNGAKSSARNGMIQDTISEVGNKAESMTRPESDEGLAKGRLEDVGLESTIDDSEPPADLREELLSDALALSRGQPYRDSVRGSELGMPPSASLGTNQYGTTRDVLPSDGEIFKYDSFFAWLFLIAQAALLSTSILVYLHTTTSTPLGDTIYTTLRASFHLLAVDTLISVIVSLVWLAALRSFAKPLILLIVVAVPVTMVSFSLYPLISSYQDAEKGSQIQDMAMRWAAIVPAACAVGWVYSVYQGRHAINSAVMILEFSSRILAANSALFLVGMGCLTAIVLWTWFWLAIFTRVFLGGYFSTHYSRFIISASSWWLGVYFVLMYMWTISVISGVQRSTTAATVSQWYFHRNAVPKSSSKDVVTAALNHAVTTIFGSISLATLLSLAIRLPLLILPRRLGNMVSMLCYSFIPTPMAALINPLTLTYGAIHSQTLAMSARGLSHMDFVAPGQTTTALTPGAFSTPRGKYAPLLPYRLAKLMLHATRFIMATALGFAGWVMTARQLSVALPDGLGFRGSAYAYVVGLIAGFIGWGVLGAMEGILSGIVDAVLVCYGSEKRMMTGGGGYCIEAATLFGDRRELPGRNGVF